MSLNKIFLEQDGLVVGANQLVTSGGGVSVGNSFVVQGNTYLNNLTVLGSLNSPLTPSSNLVSTNITTGNLSINYVTTIHEVLEVVNTQLYTGGTVNLYLANSAIFYFSSASTSNYTLNFTYDTSTSLNTFMPVGQSLTAVVIITQGGTAYYPTTIQIDGTTVTPKWQGGTAPSSGDANSIDIYTFAILKAAPLTYLVLGSATKYA
jgi:hypothetical protein